MLFTPEETAAIAHLGIDGTKDAIERRLGHRPTDLEVSEILGCSIAVKPTTNWNEETLIGIAMGPDLPAGGGMPAIESFRLFQARAEELWPDDKARQNHWVSTQMASRRIAIAAWTAAGGTA